MKLFQRLALFGVFLVLLSACATVYEKRNFSEYQARHKILAILPPNVSINAESFKPGTSPDVIRAQENDESGVFHRQLYAQFLKQFGKDKYTIEFQDVDQTNALLEKSGLSALDLRTKTRGEIAQLLGVDATISTRMYRDKPLSTGTAILSVLLVGAAVTNEVQINVGIHDGKDSRLIWNYDHLVSGGLISSAEGMAKSLMGSIAKKFPYKPAKPKK